MGWVKLHCGSCSSWHLACVTVVQIRGELGKEGLVVCQTQHKWMKGGMYVMHCWCMCNPVIHTVFG